MRAKLTGLQNKCLLWLKDAISADQVSCPPVGEFVKGINFGGDAVTIEGNQWISYEDALKNGLTLPEVQVIQTKITPEPYASRPLRQMLNSGVCKPKTLEITQQLPNGTYHLYLWFMENYQSDWHAIDVMIKDTLMAQSVGKLTLKNWSRYGPYSVTLTDGALRFTLSLPVANVDAHIMGLSIFKL